MLHPLPFYSQICTLVLTAFNVQFAQQLVACMHFVQMRHDLEKLGPNDKIREPKEQAAKEGARRRLQMSD